MSLADRARIFTATQAVSQVQREGNASGALVAKIHTGKSKTDIKRRELAGHTHAISLAQPSTNEVYP